MAFWGEPGARLSRSESAFKKEGKRGPSLFLRIVSPVFFFMPLLYMREFDDLYVDDTVHYRPWQVFIAKDLERDWENSITPVRALHPPTIVPSKTDHAAGDSADSDKHQLSGDQQHRRDRWPAEERCPDHQLCLDHPRRLHLHCLPNPPTTPPAGHARTRERCGMFC